MNFNQLMVLASLFFSSVGIASNELDDARNRLAQLKNYHQELIKEAQGYERRYEVEKNFKEALPKIAEIGELATYDLLMPSINIPDINAYKTVVRELSDLSRNDDFYLIARGLGFHQSRMGISKSEHDSLLNFYFQVGNNFKGLDSLPANKDITVELLDKEANPSLKNIVYQIDGFIKNYQDQLKKLTSSDENLNQSFTWAKKQIIENLLPALEFHFTKETIEELRAKLEQASPYIDKRLDPETGRIDPVDPDRRRITLTRIDPPNRDREEELNRLRMERMERLGDRLHDRREARSVKPVESPSLLLTPEGLALMKEISEEDEIIKKLFADNLKKKVLSFGPNDNLKDYKNFSICEILSNYGIKNLAKNPLLSFAAIFGASYLAENPNKAEVIASILLDTPFDLADFFSAMVYNQTIMGQEATTSDKVFLGAMVLVPGVSGAMAKKGVDLAKRFAKYGVEGLNELAEIVGPSAVEDILKSAEKLEITEIKQINKNAKILERVEPNFEISKLEEAAEVNLRDFTGKSLEPAYLSETKVIEFKTTQPGDFVRVHSSGNQPRPWLMKMEDIKGLNAEQIANKFNLPVLPTSISKVNLPTGTKMRMGIVGPNKFGKGSESVQYEVLDEVKDFWFTKIGDL